MKLIPHTAGYEFLFAAADEAPQLALGSRLRSRLVARHFSHLRRTELHLQLRFWHVRPELTTLPPGDHQVTK